ncbi:sulfotransferase [Vibrio sp. TBV020]|uniref:sulfotransferase n=1 Tax=Vibrio sp. TBV020 TaxID=3137398 RepID=UPI0038CD27E1
MDEITLIKELERLLKPVQDRVRKGSSQFMKTDFCHAFILGCPRSGTTALLQYLSYTNAWNYPTNLLTRFSSSLYVGMLFQRLMFDEKFGLIRNSSNIDFSSEYGRSKGAMNANEFFHFFRHYFPNQTIRYLNKEELSKVDCVSLRKDLDIICELNNKPFLTKALMFQYNLDFFSNKLGKVLYIYIRRDPIYNMQSIYKSRLSEMEGASHWWSAKPKQYKSLKDRNIFEQIAGQVLYSNYEIEECLKSIPSDNKLILDYERFVEDPEGVFSLIKSKYDKLGVTLRSDRDVPRDSIIDANFKSVDNIVWEQLLSAKNKIEQEMLRGDT